MYASLGVAKRDRRTDRMPDDSAYGGSETLSVADQEVFPTPPLVASPNAAAKRRSSGLPNAEAHLKYNHDRHELSRSISEALKVARDFKAQATDVDWPMLVPFCTAPRRERPGCPRTSTIGAAEDLSSPKRMRLKRTSTTFEPDMEVDIDDAATVCTVLSSEIEEKLQILRPEVLLAAHEENIVHTMNPRAVGEIMEQQFIKVSNHLQRLHIRVEDIASKVLVTGDLNAGKSTLCNALLRQQVLPTDQQPCTEVFCELLDARDNEDRREVHAVPLGKVYDHEDSSSFKVLSYDDLSEAVLQSDEYSALKVYVDDERPLSESLLRNGVVDISLIDAPGLNSDSLKTTAVYARQEEIDVVVFVVSAENHFTLSAKQFLWNASNEKAYLFIVVNRFDNIKDKDRCRRLILEQISKLSPQTHAAADELVHFVAAADVLSPSHDDVAETFDTLEMQLRNFVLNKRSQSKLAPAKNFVSKFWSDVRAIAKHNDDVATERNAALQEELLSINVKLSGLTRDRQQAIDGASLQNDSTSEQVRVFTKNRIAHALASMQDLALDHAYGGPLDCIKYATAMRDQYLAYVQSATIDSELHCRQATSKGVESIRQIGLCHLNADQYRLKDFNVNLMFSRKRDAIQRNLPVELNVMDFIDISNFEALVGTSSLSAALVLYGGKTLGWSALVDTSLRVMNTLGVRHTSRMVGAAATVVILGLTTYIVVQIPTALQKNLAKKICASVSTTDYIGSNANRISNECRKVLQIPENELRLAFASKVEAEQRCKFAVEKQILSTSATIEFFKRQNQIITKEARRMERVVL